MGNDGTVRSVSSGRGSRLRQQWLRLVCCTLVGGLARSAHAEATAALPVAAAPASVAPSCSAPEARDEASARRLLKEADERFRAGDAASAIPLLERAYRLSCWSGCLLNLAMAHHTLSRCEVARDLYVRYLSIEPYSERQEEVTAALKELEASCGSGWAEPPAPPALEFQEPAPALPAPARGGAAAPARAPARPLEPPASARRKLEWSLLGAGALTGVATLGFTLASQRKNLEADRFSRFSADDPRARDVHDAGLRYNHLAWGFGITTAVLWGAGATLWLTETPASATVLEASPSSLALRYRGRF